MPGRAAGNGQIARSFNGGKAPKLSALQVRIILKWLEEETGGHYGGGPVYNQEERAIMGKLDAALGVGSEIPVINPALGRYPWFRRCAGHPRLPWFY